MAKQVQVRYEHNTGALENRDLTVGRVYNAELPGFGEFDKDGVEVMFYDELWIVEDDAGDGVVTRLSTGFVLVEGSELEQDDPLPPAPESVLYVETDSPVGTDSKLLVAGSKYGGLLFEMYAQRQSDGVFAYAGMRLDPDAALQLAHDLNRMANEIKRRERAQSGE